MARVIKKVFKKTPETISDFQALLDSNKDKLSEGDYLALCNGMKSIFEKEEKEERNKLVFTQVRIMYPKVINKANSQPIITMDFRREIIHIKQAELDKIVEELQKNNIVEFRHLSQTSIVVFKIETDNLCNDCSENEEQLMPIASSEYITHIYPKEEWISHTQMCGHEGSSWGISHAHIDD
jgi:hypothetical protein